jgi:hypothetical protein
MTPWGLKHDALSRMSKTRTVLLLSAKDPVWQGSPWHFGDGEAAATCRQSQPKPARGSDRSIPVFVKGMWYLWCVISSHHEPLGLWDEHGLEVKPEPKRSGAERLQISSNLISWPNCTFSWTLGGSKMNHGLPGWLWRGKGLPGCISVSLWPNRSPALSDSNCHTPLAGFSCKNEISEFWTKFMQFAN